MPRSLSFLTWSRLAPLALLSGCLVTFNDYPVGDLALKDATGGSGAVAGSGPDTSGASSGSGGVPVSSGGSIGVGAVASGGTDVATGGTDIAGSATTGGGGTANDPIAGGPADSGGAPATDVDPNLIDDFEDGDELILAQQGRSGAWFVQNDGTGTQTPEAGSVTLPSDFVLLRSGSARGMHTAGGPFDTWGALIGASFALAGDEASPYDLSAYQGIKLWVRTNSTSSSAAKEVRLNVVTSATGWSGENCGTTCDQWGFAVPLTSKWVQVDVPFSMLKQATSGRPRGAALDLTSVMSLQFLFPANVSFDLWLDDIALY